MTGLDLEPFLHWLRADLGFWVVLGVAVLLLGLKAWTGWGTRRTLRKCLVLSVAVHLGLVLYGSTLPAVNRALRPGEGGGRGLEPVRISIGPPSRSAGAGGTGLDGGGAAWDRAGDLLALADSSEIPRPEPARRDPAGPVAAPAPLPAEAVAPRLEAPETPEAPAPEAPAEFAPPAVAPVDASEVAAPEPARRAPAEGGLPSTDPSLPRRARDGSPADRSPARAPLGPTTAAPATAGRPAPADVPSPEAPAGLAAPAEPESAPEVSRTVVRPPAPPALPESDPIGRLRAGRPEARDRTAERLASADALKALRATPTGLGTLPEARGGPGGRSLADVPPDYRPRLDPNRSARAQRAGATAASERAVERALDWLRRHQDADGRWDGGTAKHDDGRVAAGEDDFTAHCPPGEICFGECRYHDADTALTGLALLAYLGAGYTHTEGKYAQTVGRGLTYLVRAQGPDGDLRGDGATVGMYCHAMAGLALSEAYALTGDERLKGPVERAVAFVARSQATDGMAWRYRPRERIGDTSILGWVIMFLRSAKAVGVDVPSESLSGAMRWLDAVADGPNQGLAMYQPGHKVTPTMTAEAWVCRQFLGVAGPGPASDEAAAYLLGKGPEREPYNVYYWYYGTLALFQHGGPSWERWNARVRDALVSRQRTSGHIAGSWDPDDSPYGVYGGRLYCTAMATLTLEVYYRYLRLYEAPTPARPGPSR